MSVLKISLTKISPTHHQFEYVRADSSGEKLDLETKTFLFHDLLHFAVESEAHLENSFYGLLAQAKKYGDLVPKDGENPQEYFSGEVAMTERVVGALTGALKGGAIPEQVLDGVRNMSDAHGETLPSWLTTDFILNVKERMRKLQGQWNATPFGETMTLVFNTMNPE